MKSLCQLRIYFKVEILHLFATHTHTLTHPHTYILYIHSYFLGAFVNHIPCPLIYLHLINCFPLQHYMKKKYTEVQSASVTSSEDLVHRNPDCLFFISLLHQQVCLWSHDGHGRALHHRAICLQSQQGISPLHSFLFIQQ